MGSMGRQRGRRTRSVDGGSRVNVEGPIRAHWPFGANRSGYQAGYDSFEAGTLVRWGVVGRLILMWSAIMCVVILALTALTSIF